MLNDALDLEAVASGRLQLQMARCSVLRELHGTTAMLAPQAAAKGVELSFSWAVRAADADSSYAGGASRVKVNSSSPGLSGDGIHTPSAAATAWSAPSGFQSGKLTLSHAAPARNARPDSRRADPGDGPAVAAPGSASASLRDHLLDRGLVPDVAAIAAAQRIRSILTNLVG